MGQLLDPGLYDKVDILGGSWMGVGGELGAQKQQSKVNVGRWVVVV